jgi:hypothetical protein
MKEVARMTDAADSRTNQSQPETRDSIDRYSRMAASAAVSIAVLALAYFGVIYWLARK